MKNLFVEIFNEEEKKFVSDEFKNIKENDIFRLFEDEGKTIPIKYNDETNFVAWTNSGNPAEGILSVDIKK